MDSMESNGEITIKKMPLCKMVEGVLLPSPCEQWGMEGFIELSSGEVIGKSDFKFKFS